MIVALVDRVISTHSRAVRACVGVRVPESCFQPQVEHGGRGPLRRPIHAVSPMAAVAASSARAPAATDAGASSPADTRTSILLLMVLAQTLGQALVLVLVLMVVLMVMLMVILIVTAHPDTAIAADITSTDTDTYTATLMDIGVVNRQKPWVARSRTGVWGRRQRAHTLSAVRYRITRASTRALAATVMLPGRLLVMIPLSASLARWHIRCVLVRCGRGRWRW